MYLSTLIRLSVDIAAEASYYLFAYIWYSTQYCVIYVQCFVVFGKLVMMAQSGFSRSSSRANLHVADDIPMALSFAISRSCK